MDFKKIDPKQLSGNVFSDFDSGWALLSAGKKDSYNTMTISWGGLGWLWRRPVAYIFVRKSRYTHEFVDANEIMTVSFFEPEKYRKELGILGSKSGRDMDKMTDSGLTPIWLEDAPAYDEARKILICKKLYKNPLNINAVPKEVLEEAYEPGLTELHDAYIAEVISAYEK